MAGEIIGYGTTLSIAGTPVARITSVTPPEGTVGKWTFGAFDSTDATKESLPTFKEWGDASFDLVYTPAMGTFLHANLDRADKAIVITDDGGNTRTFTGFLSKLGEEISTEEGLTMSVGITPTGTVAFA